MLGERCDWVMNDVAEEGESESMGTLRVEGVVRGSRMSADRLVHLQGYGDFMVEKVRRLSLTQRSELTSFALLLRLRLHLRLDSPSHPPPSRQI